MSVLALDRTVPDAARRSLANLDDVIVIDANENVLVEQNGEPRRLIVRPTTTDQLPDSIEDRALTLMLVRGVLDEASAARLEDAGILYVDAAGRAWLPGRPRTSTARRRVSQSRRPLGSAAMRAAQLLADHPHETWTERQLAERAGASQPTVNRLLARLDAEDLVRRSGRVSLTGPGRRARRLTVDGLALRRWLLETGSGCPVTMVDCYLRSVRTGEVDGTTIVLTGASGAEALGVPVLSSVPRIRLRADVTEEDIEDLPARLGGLRTSRGANATIIADPHRLGARDARETRSGELVAPPTRVMLDILLEPRGTSAADVFLDLWRDPPTAL